MAGILLVLTLARILAGEASVLGWPGYIAVAWTIENRLEQGMAWEDVLSAYHGRANPDAEAWATAFALYGGRDALTRLARALGWTDVVQNRAIYVLSQEDVATLGLCRERAVYTIRKGPWALYLFEDWDRGCSQPDSQPAEVSHARPTAHHPGPGPLGADTHHTAR